MGIWYDKVHKGPRSWHRRRGEEELYSTGSQLTHIRFMRRNVTHALSLQRGELDIEHFNQRMKLLSYLINLLMSTIVDAEVPEFEPSALAIPKTVEQGSQPLWFLVLHPEVDRLEAWARGILNAPLNRR